ncbi:MAG TPA: hypothetical protein VFI73_09540 [Candidatus Nitrosopolaris sp.]|nr:hypothetical protein [Candidatus Nitrosopolaris sp.]
MKKVGTNNIVGRREMKKGTRTTNLVTLNGFIASAIVLVVLLYALPFQIVNAQNTASSNASTGAAAKTTITTTGKNTVITIPTSKSSNTSNAPSYNRTGFANLYILAINGKTFPIKYSINGGKLVGILADKDRTSLVLALNPSANGGNFTAELPRNVIDSKGASNADTKYLIKIDGKGVDYKEIANNVNARILSIDFSKDNRFIEIIGTQMTS